MLAGKDYLPEIVVLQGKLFNIAIESVHLLLLFPLRE
jgi:hypothetical protein